MSSIALRRIFLQTNQELKKEDAAKARQKVEDQRFTNYERDPMSAYEPIQEQIEYKNIADVVNKRGFAASFPQSYTKVSGYFLRYGITPYFNPGPDVDFARGSITIAGMIELVRDNQPLQISNEKDLEIILKICADYRLSMEPYMKDAKVANYIKNLDKFTRTVDRAIRANYKRQNKKFSGVVTDIFSLFKIAKGS